MELWIRSQDREKLLKVDEISLIGMGGHKVGIGTFTKKLKNMVDIRNEKWYNIGIFFQTTNR